MTAFGAAALDPEDLNKAGWVVFRTTGSQERATFDHLKDVTHVHLHGLPMLWAIKGILANAPNLKQIRLIPSLYSKLHPESHLKLCAERGVEVVKGHYRPQVAWKKGENRSPYFEGQRRFFLTLDGDQKKLWDELLAMKFEYALITARYFCLAGEEFVSKKDVAREYGYSKHNAETLATDVTNAVIVYLDPTFHASPRAKTIAWNLKAKVERLRVYFAEADGQSRFAESLGLRTLPMGLPAARYETFRAVVEVYQQGRLRPEVRNERVLLLRFGLETNRYMSLREVAPLIGVHWNRILQIEEAQLKALGIVQD